MTAAEAVRLYLLTLAPVTNLVNARIWTFRLPQSPTLPAVLVTQASDVQEPHLRGTHSMREARVQVDCYATTIGAARALDQAVMGDYVNGAATGLRGALASVGGSPATTFKQSLTGTYREMYESDELKQARVMREYFVSYED